MAKVSKRSLDSLLEAGLISKEQYDKAFEDDLVYLGPQRRPKSKEEAEWVEYGSQLRGEFDEFIKTSPAWDKLLNLFTVKVGEDTVQPEVQLLLRNKKECVAARQGLVDPDGQNENENEDEKVTEQSDFF